MFFKQVLLAKDGPLGTVSHYYKRIEYQQRGTTHVHILLWIKDAPQLSKNSDNKSVLEFIEKHITSRLPDKELEPTLYALVNDLQRHDENHSSKKFKIHKYYFLVACKRQKRIQKILKNYCRFNFPRIQSNSCLFNKENLIINKALGKNSKAYIIPRTEKELFINDYNPAILLAWKGNIDIQYVSSTSPSMIDYVTGYVSKNETQKSSNLDGWFLFIIVNH